jgi:hypothetical protein
LSDETEGHLGSNFKISPVALASGQDFALGNGVWQPFFDEDLTVAVNDTGFQQRFSVDYLE